MVEKEEIQELIVQIKKSSLKNHTLDSLLYNTEKYSGEIREKEILIWRSAYFLRGVYPIFYLSFDNNDKLNGLRTEMNPFGKLVGKLTILVFMIFSISMLFWNELWTGFFQTLFMLTGGFLLYLIMRKAEKEEKKILTEELKTTIEEIEREKFPERFKNTPKPKQEQKINQWTFKKTMIRFILYPFCVFIIYFSATGLIPSGKGFLGFFGIGISLAYLYADLYAIFKK